MVWRVSPHGFAWTLEVQGLDATGVVTHRDFAFPRADRAVDGDPNSAVDSFPATNRFRQGRSEPQNVAIPLPGTGVSRPARYRMYRLCGTDANVDREDSLVSAFHEGEMIRARAVEFAALGQASGPAAHINRPDLVMVLAHHVTLDQGGRPSIFPKANLVGNRTNPRTHNFHSPGGSSLPGLQGVLAVCRGVVRKRNGAHAVQ